MTPCLGSAENNANDSIDGNHGTFEANTFATGISPNTKAFSFDGTDDYVQLQYMYIGSKFSIDFWFFPTSYTYWNEYKFLFWNV